MKKKITVGFSPCPNDTFIFDALVNQKISWEGFDFEFAIEDVETLNKFALKGRLEVTKLSFHTFLLVGEKYRLLNSGAALGKGCGPLLISSGKGRPEPEDKILIPGKLTTANLLLSIYFPELTDRKEVLFSAIEDELCKGNFNYGVIIHENRFTYQNRGLFLVEDLGGKWESETGLPIPLGGIVGKENLGKADLQKIESLIRKSILFAFEHPDSSVEFIKAHSSNLDDSVIKKHIGLYVNNYSIDLGEEGWKAIKKLEAKSKLTRIL